MEEYRIRLRYASYACGKLTPCSSSIYGVGVLDSFSFRKWFTRARDKMGKDKSLRSSCIEMCHLNKSHRLDLGERKALEAMFNDLVLESFRQYPHNDVHKSSCLFTFLGIMTVFVTAYGYVYAYPLMHDVSWNSFYVLVLGLSAATALLVLCLLCLISVNFGATVAKGHAIRYRLLRKYEESLAVTIYGKRQNEYEKGKSLLHYIPDYYQLFSLFMAISQIGICVAYALHPLVENALFCLLGGLLLIGIEVWFYRWNYRKYLKRITL